MFFVFYHSLQVLFKKPRDYVWLRIKENIFLMYLSITSNVETFEGIVLDGNHSLDQTQNIVKQ